MEKDDKSLNFEGNESDSDEFCKETLKLPEEMKVKLENSPEILEFIDKLLNYIEKYKHKIKRLKSKLEKCDKVKNEEDTFNLVEDIKVAAEEATKNSGFVYEETSGMYYDYSTGYYYNAEYGLYYDGNTGTYMEYNPDTKTYVYHSQIMNFDAENQKERKRKWKTRKNSKKAKHRSTDSPENVEEGECSSDDTSSDSSNSEYEDTSSDLTKQWPPCMRIIVSETGVAKLKTGSLHIVTYEGGSVGREGNHAILIPDINISKHHLNIAFNKDANCYQIIDMGSRNGTVLNGIRMAPSKQESQPFDVVHGSKIQLGSTVLLCHIHEGHQTCGHCEPGLITTDEKKSNEVKPSKSENHKKELKNLKKKFGMSNYTDDCSKLASGYTDRAQKRRETVGSQNPHEKTQSASITESITATNKGFKLLSKMGWKEGESLGKEGHGILEPINVISHGNSSRESKKIVQQDQRQIIWKKAQERFDKLSND